MSLQIGRATGLEVIRHPKLNGDRVVIDGIIPSPGSVYERDARLWQLRGAELAGAPVPVVWSTSRRLDGAYYVVSFSSHPAGYEDNPTAYFTVVLERVAPSPTLEQHYVSGLRTNGESITLGSINSRKFVPGATTYLWTSSSIGATVSTETGDIQKRDGTGIDGVFDMLSAVSPVLQPAFDFYNGAATVEYEAEDGEWYALVGTDLPTDAIRTGSVRVRMSNGRIRLTIESPGNVVLERWVSGTTWVESPTFTLTPGPSTSPNINVYAPPEILRNTPEAVGIRLRGTSAFTYDLSLQRGHIHVEGTISNPLSGSYTTLLVKMASSEVGLGAAITGGMRRSSDDSNSMRWAILAPYATLKDTSSAYLERNTSTVPADFAIGYGSSSEITNDMVPVYFASITNTQTVVRR